MHAGRGFVRTRSLCRWPQSRFMRRAHLGSSRSFAAAGRIGLLLLVPVLLGAAGCLGFEKAPPFFVEAPFRRGVEVGKEIVHSLPESGPRAAILDFWTDSAGETVVLTKSGARFYDAEGTLQRAIQLSEKGGAFPLVAWAEGSRDAPVFIGLLNDRQALALFDERGRLQWERPCVCARLTVADVLAAPGPEIVVPSRDQRAILFYNLSGELLRDARTASGPVTALHGVAPGPSGGGRLILYNYPTAPGRGSFQVVDGQGRVENAWEDEVIGDFAVIASGQGPQILYLAGDSLVFKDVAGQEIRRLPTPHAGYFRSLQWAPLGPEVSVLVATGSGYRPYHMIAVHVGERLVFQEFGEGRAYALFIPSGETTAFQVGIGERIWQYRLSDLP